MSYFYAQNPCCNPCYAPWDDPPGKYSGMKPSGMMPSGGYSGQHVFHHHYHYLAPSMSSGYPSGYSSSQSGIGSQPWTGGSMTGY